MDRHEFQSIVREVLERIPEDLWSQVENVEFMVEDESPGEPHLYGRFHGVPLTGRSAWSAGDPPGTIELFWRPIVRDFGNGDPARLREQIRITVLHEIGHYFGIGEQRLRELGYA